MNKKYKSFYIILLMISMFSFGLKGFAKETIKVPSEFINLESWKVTLPVGDSEKPKEVKGESLKNYQNEPYFQISKKEDAIQFRAPVNGVTTSGSGYPRSELREMTENGNRASWSTTTGTHSMYIDQAITAVPKDKKHVVAGQIHDEDDDVIVIRLEDSKLFIDINGKEGPTLDENYKLGTRFTVQFIVSEGKINIHYNGNRESSFTLNKKSDGNYFKAGAYTQSNCSKEKICNSNNFGEVLIYDLKLQHEEESNAIEVIVQNNEDNKGKQKNQHVDEREKKFEEKEVGVGEKGIWKKMFLKMQDIRIRIFSM